MIPDNTTVKKGDFIGYSFSNNGPIRFNNYGEGLCLQAIEQPTLGSNISLTLNSRVYAIRATYITF